MKQEVFETKAWWCIMQWVDFTFGDRFFFSIWNPDLEPIIAGASSVQHPQRLFHERFSVSKNDATFSKKSVALVMI